MPPTLQEIQAMTTAAVDGVMGESVRHYPLADGIQDQMRSTRIFMAVVRSEPVDDRGFQGAGSRQMGARVAAGPTEAHVALAEPVVPHLRQHDKVRLMDRPGKPFFEILTITDRRSGRVILSLGAS